jgi:hypothetical protein
MSVTNLFILIRLFNKYYNNYINYDVIINLVLSCSYFIQTRLIVGSSTVPEFLPVLLHRLGVVLLYFFVSVCAYLFAMTRAKGKSIGRELRCLSATGG